MAEDEVAQLERELEEQLVEQRSSLATLRLASESDPGNQELLSICEELVAAIREYEGNLILLRRKGRLSEDDARADPGGFPGASEFLVGSKCRFRYSDGRWYYGKVLQLEEEDAAIVSFLTPTSDRMQMCKFFLQKRCRFGGNCRSSHGYRVRLPALRTFTALEPQEVEVGSVVLACSSGDETGIWRVAEIEEWDGSLQRGRLVFSDGQRLEVDEEFIVANEHPSPTDESSTSSDDSGADSESEGLTGIGYIDEGTEQQQTETVKFATWEKHTNGAASRMMARMGYVAGTGLGLNRQGLVAPLQVRVLPPGKSLDFVSENRPENAENRTRKKKSRGGKRKRDRKLAEAAKAERYEQEEKANDVFDFINEQLASGPSSSSGSKAKKVRADQAERTRVDHAALVKQEDEVRLLASKVAKLEEMAHRNRKEKAVFEGVKRKLAQARDELRAAEATHSSMAKSLHNKQQAKKWIKF